MNTPSEVLVRTAAGDHLLAALQNREVRTIGVFGPHGVGKKALLAEYGEVPFSDGVVPQVVRVKAPVRYDQESYRSELTALVKESAEPGRLLRFLVQDLSHIAPAEDAPRFLDDVLAILTTQNDCQIVIVAREKHLVGEVDELVEMDALRLTESMNLLDSTVMGLSRTLRWLVHCVAGGIPVKLVQVARRVQNPVRPQRDFASILTEIVAEELPGPADGPALAVRQTIVEVFSSSKHTDMLMRAATSPQWPGSLDALALARRLVRTDPVKSEVVLSAFREAWKLGPIPGFDQSPAEPDGPPPSPPQDNRLPLIKKLEDVRLQQLIGEELNKSEAKRSMKRAGLDRAALSTEILNSELVRAAVQRSSALLMSELPVVTAGAKKLSLGHRVVTRMAEKYLVSGSGVAAVAAAATAAASVSVVAGVATVAGGVVVGVVEQLLERGSPPDPDAHVNELAEVWENDVLETGVRPALQARFAEALSSLAWISLVTENKDRLYHVQDDRFTVDTESVKSFDRATERSGGAIGLAGPRGSGKTTLIRRRVLRGQGPITVRVSAPVRYEPRDFVLHLHSKLCREVIREFSGRSEHGHPDWPALTGRAEERRRIRLAGRRMFWSLLVLGGVTTWLLVAVGAAAPPVMAGELVQLVQNGDIPAVAALAAGLLSTVQLARAVFTLAWLPAHRKGWSPRDAIKALVARAEPPTADELMVRLAEQDLRQIRFLQTHTTGWSGKLTIPVKVDISRTSTTQLAQRPLTHPELVEQLRLFLKQLVAVRPPEGNKPSVLISIDELDKIEPPEDANRFVNEVKGVFGVRGCQFIISVSEEALTAFERRGLALRDAFDSAFDTIVRVGYLTLCDSDQLLSQRAGDIAEPFRYLCHCLSGGLPRELMRVAQNMVDMACPDEMPSLAEVAQHLVTTELDRKADSLQEAAARIGAGADVADFVRAIHECIANPSPLMLLRYAPAADSGDSPLDRLRMEARTYLRFAATILQVFNDDLQPSKVRNARMLADDPGSFDSLASVLQQLAGYPMVAALTLNRFRLAWQLDPGESPAPRPLTASQQLLRDRELILPARLELLCHCISGGAPLPLYQLATKARDLLDNEPPPPDADVARRLVLDDLRNHLQPVGAEIRKLGLGRQVDALATMVAWQPGVTAADLLWCAGSPVQVNGHLGALWMEGRTSLRFAATLLQIFTEDVDVSPELCAKLGRVAQLVAADTATATAVLDGVRTSCGLDEFGQHLVESTNGEGQVAFTGEEMASGAGNVVRQPLAVRVRDKQVLGAVPQEGGGGDVGDGETPVANEGQVVIDPAVDT
jgi:Ni2+-binding GTPase involved in maturation of urease and hydrogenase